jgi:hypothetical protein
MLYVEQVGGEETTLYVQPFPGPGRARAIASGVISPEWRGDGQEIVALSSDGDGVWRVPVEVAGEDVRFGTPERLFTATFRNPGAPTFAARLLAVSKDGSRFYYPQRVEQEANLIHVKTTLPIE